ncbi:MAG TPA: hypothetical protein VIM11_12590 [Tepidisphaeraceae bacterium]|jgi:hypothetical protein
MSIDTAVRFDPAQEVPDQYDIFCESCAYSLVGLTGDRCPECGASFNANDLPFARIPWLHRKRLGTISAYLRTVFMVCFRTLPFARELCRPVRISAADARSFRLTTIWLLTVVGAVAVGAAWAIGIYLEFRYRRGYVIAVSYIVFATLFTLAGVVGFHIFLRLATDMPLFIWKGLPSMRPRELAPVHHYASAPMLLIPIFIAIAGYVFYLSENSILLARVQLQCIAVAVTLIAPLWLGIVAVLLMHGSSHPGPGRLVLLALYLPFHWSIMLALMWMLWFALVLLEHFVTHTLHIMNLI